MQYATATRYPPSAYEQGSVPISASGWLPATGALPDFESLRQDLDADIVVVGAGLTGASAALRLAARQLAVVVLEADQPASGASGRNAGHVQPYLGSLDALRALPNEGRRFRELFIAHRRIVFDLCKEHGIEADAAPVGLLDVARKSYPAFDRDARAWRAFGYEVEVVRDARLQDLTGTPEYRHGLYWRDGGRVNPYLFTHGLVSAAVRHGARVYGHSRVIAIERIGDRWAIRTATSTVRTMRVLICTNGHRDNNVFPALAATNYPLLACGLATGPIDESVLQTLNPSRAGILQFPTGLYPFVIDGRQRLITATIPDPGQAADAERYFRRFLGFLHRAYPHTRDARIELQSYWTGETASSSAIYHADYPKLYDMAPGITAVVNIGTWGNVLAPLFGMHVADCVASERPEDLVLPLEQPKPVARPQLFAWKIRYLLMPLARLADRIGLA